jgi:hypothetical protein
MTASIRGHALVGVLPRLVHLLAGQAADGDGADAGHLDRGRTDATGE